MKEDLPGLMPIIIEEALIFFSFSPYYLQSRVEIFSTIPFSSSYLLLLSSITSCGLSILFSASSILPP